MFAVSSHCQHIYTHWVCFLIALLPATALKPETREQVFLNTYLFFFIFQL